MTTKENPSQEVYRHAYIYAQQSRGFEASTPEEEAYYAEHVRHVEKLEEAYAKGFFDGRDQLLETKKVL